MNSARKVTLQLTVSSNSQLIISSVLRETSPQSVDKKNEKNISLDTWGMLSLKQRLHFVAVAIGLFGCYSVFGILQERIFRRDYGSESDSRIEQFTFSVTFVCLQCVFYATLAKSKIHWTRICGFLSVSSLVQQFWWPTNTHRTKRVRASTLWVPCFTLWHLSCRTAPFSSSHIRVKS